MLQIGQMNRLVVTGKNAAGLTLASGDDRWGEIPLPRSVAPPDCPVGGKLDVFVYFAAEDALVATTQRPHVMVGQFNLLRVSAVEKFGAFMDWGLPKDLFVPFGEQKMRLKEGRSYIVRAFLDDDTGRIVGSTRINKFLNTTPAAYDVGQMVELIIARRTELGFTAIINDAHWGFLFHNEIFKPVRVGLKIRGYIKQIRDDGKIDLSLTAAGYGKVDGIAETILNQLDRSGGFLPLTAKTSPEELSHRFGVSKKNYKKALGALYKQRLVAIEPDGIRLLPRRPAEGTPDDEQ